MSLLPLVLDLRKYRNTEIRSNSKLSQDSNVTYQKQQEKNKKTNENRIRSIGVTRFVKNPKNYPELHEITHNAETSISGKFVLGVEFDAKPITDSCQPPITDSMPKSNVPTGTGQQQSA